MLALASGSSLLHAHSKHVSSILTLPLNVDATPSPTDSIAGTPSSVTAIALPQNKFHEVASVGAASPDRCKLAARRCPSWFKCGDMTGICGADHCIRPNNSFHDFSQPEKVVPAVPPPPVLEEWPRFTHFPGRSLYPPRNDREAVDTILANLWDESVTYLPRLDLLMAQALPLSILGHGTFGVVVLVQRNDNDIQYAVKIARKDKVLPGTSTDTEYLILQHVASPFVVSAVDFSEDEFYSYLFLEPHGVCWDKVHDGDCWTETSCIDGSTHWSQNGLGLIESSNLATLRFQPFDLWRGLPILAQFSESSVQTIVSQMVRAVGTVHSRGVVHRDIKLANFLLDAQCAKLVDFGMSRCADDVNVLQFAGTASYTPPGKSFKASSRQCSNPDFALPEYLDPDRWQQSTLNPFAQDIYCLGAAIYQLASGRKGRDLMSDQFSPVPGFQFNRPANWSEGGWAACMDIVLRCIEPNPTRRATATALLTNQWLVEAKL
ncbi:kinase-like domain-containing protein [Auriculariales sp. MPI-PUGE-AT-0066]|nr:kinase-like domain-containing protein [Auriculariales sp. MPI-PUGE-AT-0066]